MGFAMSVLEVLAFAFVGVVGTLLLIIVVVFVIDRLQTGDAIRRNYPVLGRFRHLFSQLGEFFVSISLRWTARNCHLTARNASGSNARVKGMGIPLLLAQPVTLMSLAPRSLPMRRFRPLMTSSRKPNR